MGALYVAIRVCFRGEEIMHDPFKIQHIHEMD